MPTFELQAVVKRQVVDTISLTVEAKNLSEAYTKAEEALSVYPEPLDVPGVSYMYVEDRTPSEPPQIRDIRERLKVA